MVSEVRTVVITEKERRSRDWKEVRETLLLVKIYFLTRVMVSWGVDSLCNSSSDCTYIP